MAKDTKNAGDHSYNKSQKDTTADEQTSAPLSFNTDNVVCNGCKKNLTKNIQCGFCEKKYCFNCSQLDKAAFEVLSVTNSAAWYCMHCINAVPGVSKVLVRIGNVEAKCQSLDERVTKIEANETSSVEQIRKLAHEEYEEMKEIEGRKLNLMVFNMPESKKDDVKERQTEDLESLQNIMEQKMNLDLNDIEIIKPVRVGRREILNGEITKKRPLRFTVKTFESKRSIMRANTFLRQSKDEIFGNIYFTPDLTKKQREEAFRLRERKRYRTNVLHEKNLKISRGKIIQVTNESHDNSDGNMSEGEAIIGPDPDEH